MALSLLAIGAVIVFLGVVVPMAIWASIGEAREIARINRFFREWDADTARLLQLRQQARETEGATSDEA